jgi:hypothetical protein
MSALREPPLRVGGGQIKACFVMGGVLADAVPLTISSAMLNRFSCTTMNQLYHPSNTAALFDFLAKHAIPTFVVSNNAVHQLDAGSENTDWITFIRNNAFSSFFLKHAAHCYYNSSYFPPPRKAFDYYTAMALAKHIERKGITGPRKKLYYENKYGITWIAATTFADFASVQREYAANVDNMDEPKRDAFRQEQAIISRIDEAFTGVLDVVNLDFDLNRATLGLQLKNQ